MTMADSTFQTTKMQLCLDRMRAGDEAARNELLRKMCSRLERLARRMLKSFPHVRRWTETGDVLQNALLRLLRSLKNLEPNTVRAFYGLAAREIRRELIDLARHYYGPEGLGANLQSGGATGEAAAASLDPMDPASESADLDKWCRFHEEVEKLPVELREVVSLVFYHGWTQAQVAELFQVTERTIRRRWQESLLKLRQALNGHLPSRE
jgi:RNA polymerase sigma-70 factor (ECF subfamily)